jgi:hypothetical protein
MRLLRYVIALAAFGAATPAFAACELAGASSPASAHVTYDPFSPAQRMLEFTLTVRNEGTAGCQARLYLRPLTGAATLVHNGNRLLLQFDGQRGTGSAQAGELDPFVTMVPAGGRADIAVRAILPAQQVVPPGLYSGTFQLRGDAEDGTMFMTGASGVVFEANVLARAEMSISGTAAVNVSAASMAPAALEFPNARTGQSERVFVNVWSNGSVVVSLTSRNGGVLRHTGQDALPTIAYTASFHGRPLALGAVSTFEETPPLSLSGASYELNVTLGDVANRYAGRYRDVITVTVDEN